MMESDCPCYNCICKSLCISKKLGGLFIQCDLLWSYLIGSEDFTYRKKWPTGSDYRLKRINEILNRDLQFFSCIVKDNVQLFDHRLTISIFDRMAALNSLRMFDVTRSRLNDQDYLYCVDLIGVKPFRKLSYSIVSVSELHTYKFSQNLEDFGY